MMMLKIKRLLLRPFGVKPEADRSVRVEKLSGKLWGSDVTAIDLGDYARRDQLKAKLRAGLKGVGTYALGIVAAVVAGLILMMLGRAL